MSIAYVFQLDLGVGIHLWKIFEVFHHHKIKLFYIKLLPFNLISKPKQIYISLHQ